MESKKFVVACEDEDVLNKGSFLKKNIGKFTSTKVREELDNIGCVFWKNLDANKSTIECWATPEFIKEADELLNNTKDKTGGSIAGFFVHFDSKEDVIIRLVIGIEES